MVRFPELARSCKIPVTQSNIKERAPLVRDEILRRDNLGNAQRAQIESFTGSVEWRVNFARRHGIKSIALHGQAASATVEEAADDMAKLLLIYLERHFAGLTQTQLGSCSLVRCFLSRARINLIADDCSPCRN